MSEEENRQLPESKPEDGSDEDLEEFREYLHGAKRQLRVPSLVIFLILITAVALFFSWGEFRRMVLSLWKIPG